VQQRKGDPKLLGGGLFWLPVPAPPLPPGGGKLTDLRGPSILLPVTCGTYHVPAQLPPPQVRGKLMDLCALLDIQQQEAAAMVRNEPGLIMQDSR